MKYDVFIENDEGDEMWIGKYEPYDVPILIEDLLKLSSRYGLGWSVIVRPAEEVGE